jgi:hypothetical protein
MDFMQGTLSGMCGSGASTAYPSGSSEFTHGFSGVRVAQSLVLSVVFCRDHCLLFVIFVFLLAIILSFLLRPTASDHPFTMYLDNSPLWF